jgi:hypothetical protein
MQRATYEKHAEVSAKSRSRALSGLSQIEFQSREGRAAEGTNNKENTVWAAPFIVYRYFCFSTFWKNRKRFSIEQNMAKIDFLKSRYAGHGPSFRVRNGRVKY